MQELGMFLADLEVSTQQVQANVRSEDTEHTTVGRNCYKVEDPRLAMEVLITLSCRSILVPPAYSW